MDWIFSAEDCHGRGKSSPAIHAEARRSSYDVKRTLSSRGALVSRASLSCVALDDRSRGKACAGFS